MQAAGRTGEFKSARIAEWISSKLPKLCSRVGEGVEPWIDALSHFLSPVLSLASTVLANAESAKSKRISETVLGDVSTFTKVGKEEQPFLTNVEATLADQDGEGFLDHMWFGGDFPNFTKLRVRIYIDREPKPSIDMELGFGVGVGFADPAAPWGTKFNGITGAPSGIFLNYRIPFSKNIRVTAELPVGVPRETVFWWIVRGVENLPLDISGIHLPRQARLRLHKVENLRVEPLQEFDLCKVDGAGMVFMVAMAAKSTSLEFMEAQMRAYLADSKEPQYLSSGLEDYFLGTYYFNRGLYHLPQAGLTHKDEADTPSQHTAFTTLTRFSFQMAYGWCADAGNNAARKSLGRRANPCRRPTQPTYGLISGRLRRLSHDYQYPGEPIKFIGLGET